MAIYQLNAEVRSRLKDPMGKLIRGSPEKTMRILEEAIEREKPTTLVAIGDVVASNIIRYGIKTNLIIIDRKSMRQPVKTFPLNNFKVIEAKNPAGAITSEAYKIVENACTKWIESSAIAIVVDGEEDLLALPVIKFAPLGTLVIYGQPSEGIVLVKITDKKKFEAELIMSKMLYSDTQF